jgi:hypothetical protein
MTTTRRPGERDEMESAARRPRPNVGAPLRAITAPEAFAGVTRLLRGAHHFADEALRTLGASCALLDAARLDVEFIVARRHWGETTFKRVQWRSKG